MGSSFSKPGPNASSNEVNRFLTEKYVNKRWADEDVKYEPVVMFETKRSKFDRFVKRRLARAGVGNGDDGEDSDEPSPLKKQKA